MLRRLFLFLIPVVCGFAQPVRVYSEFERIDPFGQIVAADKAESPREILSPALARNAWASFQVAISIPQGPPPLLFIVQNPDHATRLRLYKAEFVQRGAKWIPDTLAPVTVEDNGRVTDVAPQVPGQTTLVYWMDLWVAKNAPVRRTRIEVQLNTGGAWVIYPMELRMQETVTPAPEGPLEPLGPLAASSAKSARAVLRGYLCGAAGHAGQEGPLTIRRMIRRNARQDIAVARALEPAIGKDTVGKGILSAVQADRETVCGAGALSRELGAEWYLPVRGFLYRAKPAR